ncbi:MAG: hypothetical protein KIT84_37300 [Labilithrix sp.]|nr:hypothetical protein [Labilithrix sp.]MCW5816716.1 hypothetical protein [Labilithrix sp.]
MSERYVRPSLGAWLLPTIVAPFLSSVAAIVVVHLGDKSGRPPLVAIE